MANKSKILRSTTTATPASLAEGQLAYSELSGNLFIGTSGANLEKIGGNTDVLKLLGIEAGAEVNLVDSVNGQTGVVSLSSGDLSDITLTAIATNDVLRYNVGGFWENVPQTSVGVTDHDDLSNNGGAGSHATITSHMADATIHYTQASISITKSQVSDFTESDYVHVTGTETIAGLKTFSDNMVLNGDLTVNGTTTTVNSTDLVVTDNIITVNNGESGAGVSLGTAGILVDRGTSPDTSWIWNEGTDQWGFTDPTGSPVGVFVPVVTEGHVHDAGDVTTGTFADARISESSVTQHEAAINHDALLNYVADEHIAHSGVVLTAGVVVISNVSAISALLVTEVPALIEICLASIRAYSICSV